ncbi:MAG TPA: sensor domain-containing diguanylate cyclase [Burkholderiales bacterium]|jgi:diguanylate cyclase (GGDEF)-like protein/PAS domain S-box-containing protein
MDDKLGPGGDATVYKTLLESTKAIPWKIEWATQAFSYIGPQIEELLGWSQSSWLSANDWAMRIHEEDRERVVNFCISQSQAGVDHEADYRALTSGGNYVWIRDVVHVMRNAAGEVEALVGFMFDISERKKSEEELARLNKQLEMLSFKDELTGLANRRMFNVTLEKEWTRAQRSSSPLSLIMLDIDYFKQYNDHYGHLQGDECLREIGLALGAMSTRASDLVARFGGEEFAILLPESDRVAAFGVAERCRTHIRSLRMPHEKSPLGHVLTISVGVETVVPTQQSTPRQFIDTVDKLLYRAKQMGRDRAEAGQSS